MPLKKIILLAACYCCFLFSYAKDKVITRYGAVADGKTINTRFIQRAIDEASKEGGGRVVIPPGNFMTGSLQLKSGVELHLQAGACLQGSHSLADYTPVRGRNALIEGDGQENIAITGEGVLDGQGQELMLDIFMRLRSGELKSDSVWLYKRPDVGRALIVCLHSCKKIRVSGVTLKNASSWVQDYRECDGLDIRGITVQSTAYWNNDGLDITDSKNVRVTNCFINAADDALCIKSSNPRAMCENFYVDSCTLRSSASGLKFGTANAGGFRNIKVRNLTIFDTYRSAIALEAVDGGVMDHIDIQHVKARNTGNAIFIRRGHRNTDARMSTAENIYIAHVQVEVPFLKPDQGYPIEGPPDHLKPGIDKMPLRPSSYHIYGHPYLPYNLIPASIVGLPGYPVKDVVLEDIEITYGGGGDKNIAYIPLDKISTVPENPAQYPEFSMFGELPAWGFYIRHAENIQFKNVRISYKKEDFRPAIVTDDVKGLDLTDVKIGSGATYPVIYLHQTTGVKTSDLQLPLTGDKVIQTVNEK
jgi:hypothetical protein